MFNKRNKKSKFLTICVFVFSFLLSSQLLADEAKGITKELIFEGTVVPSMTSTMKWGFNDHYRGMVTYVAKEGVFFHGPVYDTKGNIIKQGTLLMKMDPTYWDRTVMTARKQLDIAKEELNFREKDYNRQKKLANTHSVPLKNCQLARSDYYKALALVHEEQNELENSLVIRNLCDYRAQFCGVVNKVLLAAGLESGEQPVIEISQLAPIRIKIKMDRRQAAKINKNNPVRVIPLGDDRNPVGVFLASSVLTDDGVSFLVDNYIKKPPVNLDQNGVKIPIVDDWMPLIHMYTKGGIKADDTPLIVPVVAVQNDSNGQYVWKVAGAQDLIPGKGIDYIYPVRKIYIKTGNFELNSASYVKEISLEKNKELEFGDVILTTDIPKGLKSEDKVCLYEGRYQFMPGDPVKVIIGGANGDDK